MYCDLIITGLIGAEPGNGSLTVTPLIPEEWDYFMLEKRPIRLCMIRTEHVIIWEKVYRSLNRAQISFVLYLLYI